MKEELTTLMHTEFCRNDEERFELLIMQITADVFEDRTKTLYDALKEYGMTMEQFEKYCDLPNWRSLL